MQAYILYIYMHPGPFGWGEKVKTFFTESSHVAYQTKGNES